jgi:hypothetical protein
VIYSNDDTDKEKRRRNYWLTVYILPVLIISIGCLAISLIIPQFHLDNTDKLMGYICSFVAGIVIWFINKHKWLPLPDGNHFHINKEEITTPKDDFSIRDGEPQSYVAEFRYSRPEKGFLLICGLVVLVYGLTIFSATSVIFPVVICCCGLLVVIPGFKGFMDRSAKLKISEKGLWTSELGFQSWHSIAKAKIEEETSDRFTELFLAIYLKNGKLKGTGYPDLKLSLRDIKDRDTIEGLIEKLNNSK